jgi:ubiquinone/menaquinone biosynthesis C-methylase UbiE
MIELIADKKMQTTKILDLSTGTGNIAIEAAKKFSNATIHAVDISEEMLKVAKAKAKEHAISNIHFYQQDVEHLDLEEQVFDVVTCGYGLFFYPSMDETFSKIITKIKKDGLFVFSSFSDNAFQPYAKIFLDLLDSEYRIRPPEKIESRLLETKEEIVALAEQVNPKNIDVEHFEIRYPMDIEEWWQLLNTTGYSGLLKQLTPEQYGKYKEKYFNILRNMSPDGTIAFNADSLFGIVTV